MRAHERNFCIYYLCTVHSSRHAVHAQKLLAIKSNKCLVKFRAKNSLQFALPIKTYKQAHTTAALSPAHPLCLRSRTFQKPNVRGFAANCDAPTAGCAAHCCCACKNSFAAAAATRRSHVPRAATSTCVCVSEFQFQCVLFSRLSDLALCFCFCCGRCCCCCRFHLVAI